MVMQDSRRSSAIGTVRGPGSPGGLVGAETPAWRTNGLVSAVLRGTAVVLLLNFDQFPRLVGRGFLIAAVVLAVPLLLHEILRPASRARTVIFWTLVVFGVLAAPGILHPPVTDYGRQKFLLLVTLTVFATLAVAVLRGRRDVEMFAAVFVLSGVVLAIAALNGDPQDGRADGFGSNPIWLARAIGGAFVALTWLYLQKRVAAWWAAGLAAFLGLGLLATGSRGPLLATVVALFVLVLAGFRLKIRRGRREWVGVGLMGALVAAVVALPSILPPRVYALLTDPSEELFDTARAEMREVSVPMIAEYPGGVGYGNWGDYSGMLIHNYPHNLWLELPAEAGWLVGGAFILATVVVAAGLWRATRRDPVAGFVLAVLAFNVVAVSTSGDVNAGRPLFAALALGVLVLAGATLPGGVRARAGRARAAGRPGVAG
ncbi:MULTISPECIES: O-antigen ligase family protein [unclassified Micromonospora]|uniref:O-antigen ligase family protein n=1 Tax=unclassified Micromonospora TaxID=2617518 RepID=UPI0020B1DB3F|nr:MULTISPECIES: O-antigen ligase family protein [unclassified Micromonospora]MDM4779444.1 O-antigen ligase family protein [Micromonospora sp. b486]